MSQGYGVGAEGLSMNTFRNKGIAFFIALDLLILLSIGAAVFLLNTYRHVNINEAISNRTRAILIAESGIAYAYWKIRINEDDESPANPMSSYFPVPGTCTLSNMPISLPNADWSIEVNVTDDGTKKTIDSIVTYPKSTVF